jgi:hypothetical protein
MPMVIPYTTNENAIIRTGIAPIIDYRTIIRGGGAACREGIAF